MLISIDNDSLLNERYGPEQEPPSMRKSSDPEKVHSSSEEGIVGRKLSDHSLDSGGPPVRLRLSSQCVKKHLCAKGDFTLLESIHEGKGKLGKIMRALLKGESRIARVI